MMWALLVVFVALFAGAEGKKKVSKVLKVDLPYISCDVCKYAANYIFSTVKLDHSKSKSKESEIADFLESMCLPSKPDGAWLRELDIQEEKVADGIQLFVARPGGVAMCNNECTTVARSCDTLMNEELDLDDISAFLWKGRKTLDAAAVEAKMCKRRCKPKKVKPYPHSERSYGESFTALSEKELDMETLMNNMNDAGMGGMNMMNREDMMNQMGEEDEYLDDYDGYGDGYQDMNYQKDMM